MSWRTKLKFSISDTNFIPKRLKELRILSHQNAIVGIQENASEKLQMIAGVQEFGCDITVTPKQRRYLHSQGLHLKSNTVKIVIPQRSYIRSTADDGQALNKLKDRVEFAIYALLEGLKNGKYVLNAAGTSMQGSIQERIGKGIPPQLHEFTVSRKGSTVPLINKGKLLNAIKVAIK